MTLSSKQTKVVYTTNGETQYPIPFFFFEAGDIECVRVNGTEEEFLSAFSVDKVGSGWVVSFGQALPRGHSLVIRRRTDQVQETNYPEGGKFPSAVVESDFDRIVAMVQEMDEELGRAVKVQANEDSAPSAEEFWAEMQGFTVRAENAAEASEGSAGRAKASETNAKASELAAKASQTAAKNSENAAKTSEHAAKGSEVAAASAAVIAVESAQGLQEAAETATTQAGIATEAAQSAQADADQAEADRIAAVAAANHAEERAGVATTEADRATAAADRAESVADVGIAAVGKPGLVAPDGVTTFVDPVTGELNLEVGPTVTFDGVTIQQDSATGDHYVPLASVTQPGAMKSLVLDGGKTPDALLGAWDNAGTLEQVLVPAGNVAVGRADKLTAARNIQAKAADGTLGAAVPWDASGPLVLPLPDVGGAIEYGTCTTAAGTAAKVGTLPGFTRQTGSVVGLRFTYAGTVANATLNVNSTGAATILVNNAALVAADTYIVAGMVALFQFDGTYWNLLNPNNIVKNIPAIRAWVHCTADGTIRASYNITSVTRTGAGAYTIVSPAITSTTTTLFLGMHTTGMRSFCWVEPRTIGSVKIYFTGTNINAGNGDFNLVILE